VVVAVIVVVAVVVTVVVVAVVVAVVVVAMAVVVVVVVVVAVALVRVESVLVHESLQPAHYGCYAVIQTPCLLVQGLLEVNVAQLNGGQFARELS
jgi:hypothetical protein